MTLRQLLHLRRSAVLRKWLAIVFDTYPPDTASFLQNEADRFANPVGYILAFNLEKVLDGLIEDVDICDLAAYVEEVVRIRAVQDFSPSRALSFTWLVKEVIPEVLGQEISNSEMFATWRAFESKVDQLTALALDIYSECKDKIYQLKLRELREESNALVKILRKSGG